MRPIKTIIFHHSLSDFGDVETIREWHKERGFADIGYHYVILRNGVVQEGRPVDIVGAHANGRNKESIGVCIVGDFNKYPPAKVQIESAKKLYKELSAERNLDIEFHHELCPGYLLNRESFKDRLQTKETT